MKQHPDTHSRVAGLWIGLIVAAVVFALLLIFILQNGRRVEISIFGADGTMPLGVALLLAAIGGALLVAIPGSIRITQLRRMLRPEHLRPDRE
ncbi:LapA family protein [Micromonospora sp. CPCC 206061]|uniref:LapA family protein n=1 Tax=Micromonospora sp. CPCC 206061 TaxID=3122410 RepID=UPI002FF15C90